MFLQHLEYVIKTDTLHKRKAYKMHMNILKHIANNVIYGFPSSAAVQVLLNKF